LSNKVIKKLKAQYIAYNLEVLDQKNEEVINPDFTAAEESEEEKTLEDLNKEDLENIKRSAYQEGFSKGYEEGRRLGYEEGFKEGLIEGKEKGYEEGKAKAQEELEEEKARLKSLVETEVSRLKSLIERLDREAKELVLNLDKEILNLAIMVAEKILFTKPRVDGNALLNLIRECLNFVAEGLKVKIRIHPRDLALIKEHLDELPPTYQLEFEEDPSLTQGGIILSSSTGIIDATLETRIKQVLSRLKDAG